MQAQDRSHLPTEAIYLPLQHSSTGLPPPTDAICHCRTHLPEWSSPASGSTYTSKPPICCLWPICLHGSLLPMAAPHLPASPLYATCSFYVCKALSNPLQHISYFLQCIVCHLVSICECFPGLLPPPSPFLPQTRRYFTYHG